MPHRLVRTIMILLVMGGVLLHVPSVIFAQPTAPQEAVSSAQAPESPPQAAPKIDSGDTAWMLTSSALVLLMTAPGLALFYAGLVRRKNALGTIMHSFITLALISVQWTLLGYSLAFGPDTGGIIGNLAWVGLHGVGLDPNADYAATIPHQAYMVYQMMFAAITPALITGAFAERMKFSSFLLFTLLCSRVATGISWSSLGGLKGVKPPEAFGERSRDWSLGHTGDEGPQVAMTGEARGCSRAAAPVCGFSRGTTARSVSLSWGAREVGSPCKWRGGARLYSQVIVGESGLETC